MPVVIAAFGEALLAIAPVDPALRADPNAANDRAWTLVAVLVGALVEGAAAMAAGAPQDLALHAGAIAAHLPDVVLGLAEALEHILRRRQETLARGRQDEPLADPQEERGAEARFDVTQLVAERRLGEVELIPGAGQAADVRDRGHQLEVADFEIHTHETTSS